MSQTHNLGKVSLTPRGAYNETTTYEQLDVVTYNGSAYIVLQSVTGVTPPNPSYYQVIASKGDSGADGSSATVTAGSITMLPLGSSPTVTNAGTANAAVFNFGIPYSSISDNSVSTAKIVDSAVTTNKIADEAVTTDELQDRAVTTDKLANNAVMTNKIQDGAVTEGKIANGSVTTNKLSSDVVELINQQVNMSTIGEQLGELSNYYGAGTSVQLSNCQQTSVGISPLTVVGTSGTQATIKLLFPDFASDYTSGDTYYFQFTIESSTACTGFAVKNFAGSTVTEPNSKNLRPAPNAPSTFSFTSSSYNNNRIQIIPTISSGVTGVTFTITNVYLINLTKCFGTGTEPSRKTIDYAIDRGVDYLYSPKDYAAFLDSVGIKNVFYDRKSGTLSGTSSVNMNNSIINTSDYVSGVSKGYGAYTFQVIGSTRISRGNVKAGSHYNCSRDLTADEVSALNNGDWVTISIANGRTGGNDTKVSYNITFYFEDSTITNSIQWRNPIGINLTEAFGEGNEPSRAAMDLILSRFPDRRPINEYTALTTAQATAAQPRGIQGVVGENNFVSTTSDGNVLISSEPYSAWSGWSEIGTYGQSNVATIPIYNKVHGTIETDGMVSVFPLWGCWSANASSSNTHNGAHVFHGWTTDRMHRLTMTQNIYSDDEAAIFNYIPGDKSGTSGGIFLPLRLGTDSLSNGLSLIPVYVEGSGFAFRAKLTGIMNLNYKDGVFPKPTSSSSNGTKGDICFDSDYIYVCVDTNSWKRVSLTSF